MLLPIAPPSAEPMVTPGTLRTAWSSVVAPCDCISALFTTITVWGTSIRLSAPSLNSDPRVAWKSPLGRDPVTVTVCIVAGACTIGWGFALIAAVMVFAAGLNYRYIFGALLAALPASADPCGERGEFHSCVYAGPMFRTPLALDVGVTHTVEPFVWADLTLRHTP